MQAIETGKMEKNVRPSHDINASQLGGIITGDLSHGNYFKSMELSYPVLLYTNIKNMSRIEMFADILD